jgi:hypothetical protein
MTARTPKQTDNIFFSTPGAWYGNLPDRNNGFDTGHLVVDKMQVLHAAKYLSRFYFVTLRNYTTDEGAFLDLTPRH